ncbi:facilitated trehalose transporter Tret1-like isoform X2 [Plodia interpunctella]|nr:facilitated trehalose transporter Tret1-like isoform X2 [Plodia interpunctella]XP_053619071.1 facilitated trehalose transporter Tret1-like isoform X2 [Plodia interpunctella]
MSQHGLVMGFTAILLPQLRRRDSPIPIGESAGSWIASILGFALIGGNFIAPTIMAKFGRRTANLVSVVPALVGWFCILLAPNIVVLLVARVLQGISMGMSATLSPILIGEYTSPNNRGAFLTIISLSIAIGVLTVHSMGSYLSWQTTALICAFITFTDLLIIINSPESPSWLADQGRYDDCKRVFRWLRGDGEEEELKEMIEATIVVREARESVNISQTFSQTVKTKIAYFGSTLKKKEFLKPIFIMIHIYTLSQWAGANLLAAYSIDIFTHVIGSDANVPLMVITLDVQRIISNSCAIFVIKKVKRRMMLFITVAINIIAFLSIALYTYAKTNNMLPWFLNYAAVGIFLIHLHMFSIATGTVPLPFIIAGELFPLEYRSIAGGISVFFLSANLFITVKTAPHLFATLGIYGAYCVYAAVIVYCLVVAGISLPETKDRTLQDIEDEFRGRPLTVHELKSVQSLTSWRRHSKDRRCSSPFIQ